MRTVEVDLNVISEVPRTSALKNLVALTGAIKKNTEVSISRYKGDLVNAQAFFKSKSQRDTDQVIKVIKRLDVSGLEIKDLKSDEFNISFKAK